MNYVQSERNNTIYLLENVFKDIYFDNIFIYLTITDLIQLSKVCKKFKSLIDEYFDRMEMVLAADFYKNVQIQHWAIWPKFFLLFRNNKSICHLDLSNCRWINESGFLNIICRQNRLKTVNLSSAFHLTNRCLENMSMYCPLLEKIILENCSWIHSETILLIADNCPQLQFLNVSSCWNLNDDCIEMLLQKRGLTLKNLILSRIYSLTDKTMYSIKTLADVLIFLDISFCWKITDSGLR